MDGKNLYFVKTLLIALSLLSLIAVSRAQDAAASAQPASAATRPTAPLAVGTVAPDFTTQDPSGRDVKLSDFKGKVVVLDFWATWCGPCMMAMPHTQAVAKDFKDKNVVVLASCTSDTVASYKKWVPAHQANYPDILFTVDPAERGDTRASHSLYGVQGIPTQFVIGTDGLIKAVIVGFAPGDLRLEVGLSKADVAVDPSIPVKEEQREKVEAAAAAKSADDEKKPVHTEFGSLKAGDAMPQFTVAGTDGKAIALSDFKGKTVVLGFWLPGNTSAHPTPQSEALRKAYSAANPHLSDIAARYQDQGVVVLNVCMYTAREKFDAWAADNKDKYSFVAAFDLAGVPAKDPAIKPLMKLLAGAELLVRPPAAFVVDAEGKFLGYAKGEFVTGDGLALLLQQAGVKLAAEDLPKEPVSAVATGS